MKAQAHEKVVYILGAGFSAQFGLPVMSNFLEMSKDMYAIDAEKYKAFDKIYKEIDTLRRCKDFFEADMTNIEEILSLFEMGKMLGSKSKQVLIFQNFIADVIKYYTPDPNVLYKNKPGGYLQLFIKYIFRLTGQNNYNRPCYDNNAPTYSILSFNYDSILDDALRTTLSKSLAGYQNIEFCSDITDKLPSGHVPYVQLHGRVAKPTSIVTPTWRKDFSGENSSLWKNAGKILREANHIRILGYSLPVTDSYLKYFLKWGAAHEQNLKSIDVICRDDEEHTVEKRYKDFMHNKLNFYNKTTEDYLIEIQNGIENAHEHLFQEKRTQSKGII